MAWLAQIGVEVLPLLISIVKVIGRSTMTYILGASQSSLVDGWIFACVGMAVSLSVEAWRSCRFAGVITTMFTIISRIIKCIINHMLNLTVSKINSYGSKPSVTYQERAFVGRSFILSS